MKLKYVFFPNGFFYGQPEKSPSSFPKLHDIIQNHMRSTENVSNFNPSLGEKTITAKVFQPVRVPLAVRSGFVRDPFGTRKFRQQPAAAKIRQPLGGR